MFTQLEKYPNFNISYKNESYNFDGTPFAMSYLVRTDTWEQKLII